MEVYFWDKIYHLSLQIFFVFFKICVFTYVSPCWPRFVLKKQLVSVVTLRLFVLFCFNQIFMQFVGERVSKQVYAVKRSHIILIVKWIIRSITYLPDQNVAFTKVKFGVWFYVLFCFLFVFFTPIFLTKLRLCLLFLINRLSASPRITKRYTI